MPEDPALQVSIGGDVAAPFELGGDLGGMPTVEQRSDFHCVTTWSILDVAWSGWQGGALTTFDDAVAPAATPCESGAGGDGAAPEPASAPRRSPPQVFRVSNVERYAVIEPGALITGRGPVGGGMAIGSKPAVPAASSAKAKAPAAPVIPSSPGTLSIRQVCFSTRVPIRQGFGEGGGGRRIVECR